MSIKYIYVDDEDRDRIVDYVRALSNPDELDVENIKPQEFSELIDKLYNNEKDGILLDWRLDKIRSKEVFFKASSIAQNLRTKFAENDSSSVPIVLISTDEHLSSYYSDETSHDLFDRLYDKLKDVADAPVKTQEELVALANGYKQIRELRNEGLEFYSILDIEGNETLLDKEINSLFSPEDNLRPTQEYAQFILKDLIDTPGPLINERYLAARLGIEIEKSKSWEKLKNQELNCFKYTGPFSDGWDRWWSLGLENWWQEFDDIQEPLQLLDAEERVKYLTEKFSFADLTPAKPIESEYSTEYWTTCRVFNAPLDPSDGFKIRGRERFPWQEKIYISSKAARQKKHETQGFKIHSSEQDRLNEYLKNYKGE